MGFANPANWNFAGVTFWPSSGGETATGFATSAPGRSNLPPPDRLPYTVERSSRTTALPKAVVLRARYEELSVIRTPLVVQGGCQIIRLCARILRKCAIRVDLGTPGLRLCIPGFWRPGAGGRGLSPECRTEGFASDASPPIRTIVGVAPQSFHSNEG
jgi:hypothetical protein